ncbi:hypothetical protein [Acinetobacter sp. CFCC 10889]|uniref:hypothetical protein n=1 Tax=Acinetobacter sp. CFCC 10889 TaxID=1775557 RepID=UPI0013A68C60|nr:hypothetical protein [Acinetobacter sp. CFCC 10889]
MSKKLFSKYYYHGYVVFIMVVLGISGTYSILFLNFSATPMVNIVALVVSTILYFTIILYFFYLSKKQFWIIPRHWRNFKISPLFHSLILLPMIFIPLCWINCSKVIPMIYTKIYGIQTVEILEINAKEYSSKNGTTYCLSSKYSCLPIFKINYEKFKFYQNKKVILQITSQKSSLGTIIHSIDHIRVSEKKN